MTGIENLTGSDFDDVLLGDAGANTIDGGAGSDVLSGEGGSDVLIGGAGFDALSPLAPVAASMPYCWKKATARPPIPPASITLAPWLPPRRPRPGR